MTRIVWTAELILLTSFRANDSTEISLPAKKMDTIIRLTISGTSLFREVSITCSELRWLVGGASLFHGKERGLCWIAVISQSDERWQVGRAVAVDEGWFSQDGAAHLTTNGEKIEIGNPRGDYPLWNNVWGKRHFQWYSACLDTSAPYTFRCWLACWNLNGRNWVKSYWSCSSAHGLRHAALREALPAKPQSLLPGKFSLCFSQ